MITILILDNEEQLFTNIKQYFKKKNFKIKSFINIPLLEQELEMYFPDILIINTNLVHKQQEEILKTINRINKIKYIPKIFLTIKSLTEDRINGYNSGCDAYLSKPFDPEELEAIINNLIKQNKNRLAWLLQTYLRIKKIKINFIEILDKDYIYGIPLTIQEEKILKKILEKKTNLEIATELKLTKRTIERYVTKLLYKTNLNVRTDLNQFSTSKLNWANDGNRTRE